MELSKKEISRQDFVDNSIFELLKVINPSESELDWDIEVISEIREVVQSFFVEKSDLCTEKEFYPFFEE
jgi:hypothetical protein